MPGTEWPLNSYSSRLTRVESPVRTNSPTRIWKPRLRQRVASGRSCQANIRVVDLAVARHVVAEVSVRYQTTSRVRPDRLEVGPVDSAIPVDVTGQLSKGDGRGGQSA